MRVLVVEDSLVVRTYVCALLAERPDIAISAVDNGADAVAAAAAYRPDVILMDLHLPGMDGLEAIAHIMHATPCPIVVLSGELSRTDVDMTFEAFRAGAVEVLAKGTTLMLLGAGLHRGAMGVTQSLIVTFIIVETILAAVMLALVVVCQRTN